LLGNIGIPPFDKIDEVKEGTIVVFEMSAHQLQLIHHSPHIAVLLNLFPEHLDHFSSLEKYFSAKMNIGKFQDENDKLIVEESISGLFPSIKSTKLVFGRSKELNAVLSKNLIKFSKGNFMVNLNKVENPLAGEHNLNNLVAAMLAVNEAGVSFEDSIRSLSTFKTLPHRLEFVGNFGGVNFYNDSISTVPESAIAAVKSLPAVDTIILGGFDRGINYGKLIEFISTSDILNLIFLGKAGDAMIKLFSDEIQKTKNFFKVNNLQEAFLVIKKNTKKGSTCLLSPAAASYDQFHNFEHRGDVFKELARNFS
jgi:UDP-N-acetylmuramoyl-L-alanine---L-glutamate ligase